MYTYADKYVKPVNCHKYQNNGYPYSSTLTLSVFVIFLVQAMTAISSYTLWSPLNTYYNVNPKPTL